LGTCADGSCHLLVGMSTMTIASYEQLAVSSWLEQLAVTIYLLAVSSWLEQKLTHLGMLPHPASTTYQPIFWRFVSVWRVAPKSWCLTACASVSWLEQKLTHLGMLPHPAYRFCFVLDRTSMFHVTSTKSDGSTYKHQVRTHTEKEREGSGEALPPPPQCRPMLPIRPPVTRLPQVTVADEGGRHSD
jgi:hypothetical protein